MGLRVSVHFALRVSLNTQAVLYLLMNERLQFATTLGLPGL